MSELTDKLELIRYGYINASANNEVRHADNSIDDVIRDVEELELMLELAWCAVCEAGYQGYSEKLHKFMKPRSGD